MRLRPQIPLKIAALLLLTTCCPEAEPDTFIFNIESVEPLNFNHNTIEFVKESNSEISAYSYAMVLETTTPSVKNAKPKSRGGGIFRSPDCTGSVDPLFMLEDEIIGITIVATQDFSQSYPAGADLSLLFSPILITKDNPFSTPPSLVEYFVGEVNIQNLNRAVISHHDGVDYRKQVETSFYGLRLLEQPTKPVLLQFKLSFIFQSGRTISGFTKPILLK